jgi:hypothetical protein
MLNVMSLRTLQAKGYTILVEFPDRWWFRYGVYIQAIYGLLNPETRHWILQLVWIITLYLLRSPDMWIVDEGLLIRVLWSYRVIPWANIHKARLTPKQIFIYDGFGFLLPIFAFYWRRNFKEMQSELEYRLGDKAKKYRFPLPL